MRAPSFPFCMLALAACAMPEPPGELIGKYAITGTLLENTCGEAALPVAQVLQYGVELRADERSAYWLVGNPPAHLGRKIGSDEYEFRLEQLYQVPQEGAQPIDPELAEMDPLALYGYDALGEPAEPEGGHCTLIVEESVHAQVFDASNALHDAGSLPEDEGGLLGTNAIEMRASAGSECGRVLETAGGPFEQLPCAARYELEGDLLDD